MLAPKAPEILSSVQCAPFSLSLACSECTALNSGAIVCPDLRPSAHLYARLPNTREVYQAWDCATPLAACPVCRPIIPSPPAVHIFRSRGVWVRSQHCRPYACARTSLVIESQNIFLKIKIWGMGPKILILSKISRGSQGAENARAIRRPVLDLIRHFLVICPVKRYILYAHIRRYTHIV